MLDPKSLLNSLDSFSQQVPYALDVITELKSFDQAFPNISRFASNPRAWWDQQVAATEGTYLDYGTWATEPLKAFDSLATSFGAALPQAAAMAYGMAPAIAKSGPTVGEFLADTKNLGSALGRTAVRVTDKMGETMLPPSPPAMALAGGGVMAVPVSGEAAEAAVAVGVCATGSVMEPTLPTLLAATAAGRSPKITARTLQSWSAGDKVVLKQNTKLLGHSLPKGAKIHVYDILHGRIIDVTLPRGSIVDVGVGKASGGKIRFFLDGSVNYIGRLAEDSAISETDIVVKKGSSLSFFPYGKPQLVTFVGENEIPAMPGVHWRRGNTIEFFFDGGVYRVLLVTRQMIGKTLFDSGLELLFSQKGDLVFVRRLEK